MQTGLRLFSNFKQLDPEEEKVQEVKKPKFDPQAEDPEIPEEDFKRMQSSIARFS